MNCNDAFDRLTSLDSARDPALERHLAACPRCRDMAETLAPALDLFARTSDIDELAPRPSTAAVTIARRSANRLSSRTRQNGLRSRWKQAVAWLATGAAGAACCLLLLKSNSPETDPVPTTVACPRQSASATEWMNRNSVPVTMACIACHPPLGQTAAAITAPHLPVGATLVPAGTL